MQNLINSNCTSSPILLSKTDSDTLLVEVNHWEIDEVNNIIFQEFKFNNYYKTMAFINAVAWIAHQEDHHPDIKFGYNKCTIEFSTHSVSGLSKNDFICAAKINCLISIN